METLTIITCIGTFFLVLLAAMRAPVAAIAIMAVTVVAIAIAYCVAYSRKE